MDDVKRALRKSQCRGREAGVTSEYLRQVCDPGMLVHVTSVENANNICNVGLGRVGRLHIHLGRMAKRRHVGIIRGSDVAVAIGGNRCATDGIQCYESANHVMLTEGINGRIPQAYIAQIFFSTHR